MLQENTLEILQATYVRILKITRDACYATAHRRPSDITERMQTLLDLSTFDCSKPNVVEMLRLIADPRLDIKWDKLNVDSHHGEPIIFPTGTFISILLQHDGHDYPVPSYGIITGWQDHLRHRRKKRFMQAMRQDGTIGGNLFMFNPYHPHFEPCIAPQKIETFLSNLPNTLQVRTFLQSLEDSNGSD